MLPSSDSPGTDWWHDHLDRTPPSVPASPESSFGAKARPLPRPSPPHTSAAPATRAVVTLVACVFAFFVANAVIPAGSATPASRVGTSDPVSILDAGDEPDRVESTEEPPPSTPSEGDTGDEHLTPGDDPPADGDPTTPVAPTVPVTGTFELTLTGEVSGRTFSRAAQLVVTETVDEFASVNGINEMDFCLTSGFPPGDPQVGAIWFGTNSGCLPSSAGADIDMARVVVDDRGVTAVPDENLMATGINTLTADDGLMSVIYWIQDGEIRLDFDGDEVTGTIEIRGFCGPCTFGPGSDGAWYSAELSGRLT